MRWFPQSFFALCISVSISAGAALDTLLERSPFMRDGTAQGSVDRNSGNTGKSAALSEEYEIRGFVSLAGRQMVSVWDKAEKKAIWVPVGEELYPGFPVFADYDPANRAIWAKDGDRSEQLALIETDTTNVAKPGKTALSFNSNSRGIEQGQNPQPNAADTLSGAIQNNRRVIVPNRRLPTEQRNTGSIANNRLRSQVGSSAPPPPSFVGGGRVLGRAPNNPGSNSENEPSGGLPANNSGASNGSGSQQPGSSEAGPNVQRPAGVPPNIPTTLPPQNIPQLPPGFDLEAYLESRSNNQ